MSFYEETEKRKFKFYMTDEFDNEYTFEQVIDDYDREMQDELDYILERFKDFLAACGWREMSLSKMRYLEDDEWKYVLQQYGEWDSEKERVYQMRKKAEKTE